MPDIDKYSKRDFERPKQHTKEGVEFWYARDLKDILEYEQWRNFLKVVEKAKESCRNSKNDVGEHFADVSKMVEIGSEAKREIDDIMLSRYACYLIVQNGDPRKQIIAFGQTYFAVKTRERENIQGKENTNKTHHDVGKKVRQTIEELGGTMPEELEVPEKSTKEIEKKQGEKLLQGESQ